VDDSNAPRSWQVEMEAFSLPSVDELSMEILREAAKDPDGTILTAEGPNGDYTVTTNGKEWKAGEAAETRKDPQLAITALLGCRYIEETDFKPGAYRVTELGHQVARASASGS
jgi:hypothetical protein